MEIPILVQSLKSSILSSTSLQGDKTFRGVVSAAVEQNLGVNQHGCPGRREIWRLRLTPKSEKFQSEQFLTFSNLSNVWHFPIWAVSDTFQSQQFLTLSNSDTFQSQLFLTLSNLSNFWHFPILILSNLNRFWHFLILTLSNPSRLWHLPILTLSKLSSFWHFPILTLSNFAQNGQKMDSDTFQFWHFPISRKSHQTKKILIAEKIHLLQCPTFEPCFLFPILNSHVHTFLVTKQTQTLIRVYNKKKSLKRWEKKAWFNK